MERRKRVKKDVCWFKNEWEMIMYISKSNINTTYLFKYFYVYKYI